MQKTSVAVSKKEADLWTDFEALLCKVSQRRLILCAAGNGSDEKVAYPANLRKKDNGIVAIGARTSCGLRSSYSSGRLDKPDIHRVSGFALSGDGERVERETTPRLDHYRAGFGMFEESQLASHDYDPMAVESIISTDVPGRFGYNGSEFLDARGPKPSCTEEGPYFDVPSLYCLFSGTSAATAVTAGILSLAISAGKTGRPGDENFNAVEQKNKLLGVEDCDVDYYNGETGMPEIVLGNFD